MKHYQGLRSRNLNSFIIDILREKPVAFNPALARMSKRAVAGLFLSQLLFWWEKGADKEWVYKTVDEMNKETLLTRREQERAVRIWKELRILEVQLRGLPRKRHFRIDVSQLITVLASQYGVNDTLNGQSARTITESIQRKTNIDKNHLDLGEARSRLVRKLSVRKETR